MTPQSITILATLAVLTSAGIYELRLASRQAGELHSASGLLAAEDRQVEKLRAEQASLVEALHRAEQQLATLSATPSSAPSAKQTAVNAWLQRLKQLRQLAANTPAQCIPEMALLSEADWLRVAQRAAFDDDHEKRLAFAELRTRAKQKFLEQLRGALRRFSAAVPQEAPSSILTLAGNFEGPVDPAMLQRYEIVNGSLPSNPRNVGLVVREISPVDEIYDSRTQITATGYFSDTGPGAWMPDYRERYGRAVRAYGNAHNGARASKTTALLPYFDPPLDPSMTEYIRRTEH